jgi:hypothetical protein
MEHLLTFRMLVSNCLSVACFPFCCDLFTATSFTTYMLYPDGHRLNHRWFLCYQNIELLVPSRERWSLAHSKPDRLKNKVGVNNLCPYERCTLQTQHIIYRKREVRNVQDFWSLLDVVVFSFYFIVKIDNPHEVTFSGYFCVWDYITHMRLVSVCCQTRDI